MYTVFRVRFPPPMASFLMDKRTELKYLGKIFLGKWIVLDYKNFGSSQQITKNHINFAVSKIVNLTPPSPERH